MTPDEKETINSYMLKLTGKAELPRDISIGNNYHVSLEGSVPSVTESDNNNGTHDRIYTFKPVKIELLDEKGETLKLKDARRKSQLLHGALWHAWKFDDKGLDKDVYYEKAMSGIIKNIGEIIEMYFDE